MTSWQTKRLNDVTIFIKDGTHGTHSNVVNGIALLSAKDIRGGSVVFEDARLISKEEFNKIHSKYCIENGDVLLTIVGSLGRVALVGDYMDNYTFQRSVAIIRPNCEVLSGFLFYVFQSNYFQCELQKKESKGAQGGVYLGEISKLKISTPSILEQQAIVAVMRDFDDYLEKVQKKLETSRQLKKGLVQQIFSGRLRFKDDNGQDSPDWEKKKLSEILKERRSYSEKGRGYEHVSLTKEGVIPKSERYNRDFLVKDDEIKKYKITRLGDICYNPANLKFGVICRNNYSDGIFSPIYITFEVEDANEYFIEYFVMSKNFIGNALSYEQGTVYERMSVSPEDLLSMQINLPSINEQQKIAEFLNDIDEMISSLEKLLESAKDQKKWLLNNLVTGKIRLKEFRDE